MRFPWIAPTLRVRSLVAHDATRGLTFLTLRDDDGNEIDGTIGLDALARTFRHRGKKVRVPKETRRLLALLAENGGGRWVPQTGFAIRDEDVPDALRAFRALPEADAPKESPEIQRIEIDARPVEPADFVELERRRSTLT